MNIDQMVKRVASSFIASGVSQFIKRVESWGYKNPMNRNEIIIDDVIGIELVNAYDEEVYLQHIRSFEKGKGKASRILKKMLKLKMKPKLNK